MSKERRIVISEDKGVELMYRGSMVIALGFANMIKIVTAPFVLQGEILFRLDEWLDKNRLNQEVK